MNGLQGRARVWPTGETRAKRCLSSFLRFMRICLYSDVIEGNPCVLERHLASFSIFVPNLQITRSAHA